MNDLNYDNFSINELAIIINLDTEEKQLLESIENDEWVSIPNEKEEIIMLKSLIYTDEDLEFGEIMEDFFPPPEELVLKSIKVEIPLELTEKKFSFLKEEASKKISLIKI